MRVSRVGGQAGASKRGNEQRRAQRAALQRGHAEGAVRAGIVDRGSAACLQRAAAAGARRKKAHVSKGSPAGGLRVAIASEARRDRRGVASSAVNKGARRGRGRHDRWHIHRVDALGLKVALASARLCCGRGRGRGRVRCVAAAAARTLAVAAARGCWGASLECRSLCGLPQAASKVAHPPLRPRGVLHV